MTPATPRLPSAQPDLRRGTAAARVPLSLPGAWQSRAPTDDVDVHAGAQPEWQQTYQQLSGGAFQGLVHHVQLPGLRLVREDSSRALHQRGDLGQGAYGFAMPLAASGPAIFNGQRVTADTVMVGRGDELDLVTPERFSLLAVVVDGELLNPLWERMYGKPLAAWLETQLVTGARPAAADAVRGLHLQALARLSGPDAADTPAPALLRLRDALLMEWIEALPERVTADALPAVATRRRLVDRACQLMLAPHDEPPTLLQVCQQVGASRRKLELCFQEVLGTSPARYLRAVRLNGVRRLLRGGAPSVQQAAEQWGFFHLGQFARDYRAQFGELPSQTRRRPAGADVC